MHSSGSISAVLTSIERPTRSAGVVPGSNPDTSTGAVSTTDARCVGAISDIIETHHAVSAVRTRPLSGMGSLMTTSNALIRSEATNSRCPSSVS